MSLSSLNTIVNQLFHFWGKQTAKTIKQDMIWRNWWYITCISWLICERSWIYQSLCSCTAFLADFIIISKMPTKWVGNGRSKCYFMFWTDIDSLTFFSSKSDKSAFIYLLTATKCPPLSVVNSIATFLLFTIL